MNFNWVGNPSAWIGLLTLVALEVVLGIDNIVFISILSQRLPKDQEARGRQVGLILAVIPRIVLLLGISWVLKLQEPLFHVPFLDDPEHKGEPLGLSGQDLIVIIGGVFLLGKATTEIHHKLEGEDHTESAAKGGNKQSSFVAVMAQIMILNIVFSLDSIITAIGMVPADQVTVMILAVIISTILMAFTVNIVNGFINRHPTFKMLALSFLLLIGMTLVIEGLHFHIPKGYVYFAMAFSVIVEILNLRLHKAGTKPVKLVDQECIDDKDCDEVLETAAAPKSA